LGGEAEGAGGEAHFLPFQLLTVIIE